MKGLPTRARTRGLRFSLITILFLTFITVTTRYFISPPPVKGISNSVVISQVYGAGGNSGATLTNDFIELFNKSNTTINLTGWSVQYASAAGTTWQKTNLTGSIPPGGYFFIEEGAGTGGTVSLPTPDVVGTIAMASTAGKVALVNNSTLLTGSGCPFGSSVIDFVGYGSTASCFEGSGPTPAPTTVNAVF